MNGDIVNFSFLFCFSFMAKLHSTFFQNLHNIYESKGNYSTRNNKWNIKKKKQFNVQNYTWLLQEYLTFVLHFIVTVIRSIFINVTCAKKIKYIYSGKRLNPNFRGFNFSFGLNIVQDKTNKKKIKGHNKPQNLRWKIHWVISISKSANCLCWSLSLILFLPYLSFLPRARIPLPPFQFQGTASPRSSNGYTACASLYNCKQFSIA